LFKGVTTHDMVVMVNDRIWIETYLLFDFFFASGGSS
jgi:hypothetical protein